MRAPCANEPSLTNLKSPPPLPRLRAHPDPAQWPTTSRSTRSNAAARFLIGYRSSTARRPATPPGLSTGDVMHASHSWGVRASGTLRPCAITSGLAPTAEPSSPRPAPYAEAPSTSCPLPSPQASVWACLRWRDSRRSRPPRRRRSAGLLRAWSRPSANVRRRRQREKARRRD
jgi:hypothetical protein